MRCGRRGIQMLPPPAGLVALADNTWCSSRWHQRRPCIGGSGIGRAQARNRAVGGRTSWVYPLQGSICWSKNTRLVEQEAGMVALRAIANWLRETFVAGD